LQFCTMICAYLRKIWTRDRVCVLGFTAHNFRR
jgi:hypothetical protein